MAQMENMIISVAATMLQNGVIGNCDIITDAGTPLSHASHPLPPPHTLTPSPLPDFYEEMLALLDLFTTTSISQQMWQLLFIIYEAFSRDGADYFTGRSVCEGVRVVRGVRVVPACPIIMPFLRGYL